MPRRIILHHYPGSPFAEKARLALGARGLEWHSVHIPVIMPKPELMPLTGGYRRTPVMQIGADVYCDTALIVRVLERLAPLEAPDAHPATRALAETLALWADRELFNAAVAYALQPAALPTMFEGLSPEAIAAFVEDRKRMREGGTVPRMSLPEATALLHEGLGRLQDLLADGRAFLFGERPLDADFSAYHPLWFVARVPALAPIFDAYPAVAAWMKRVAAIGHGSVQPMTAAEALEVARGAEPADAGEGGGGGEHGLAPDAPVTVAPTDYGIVPVAGRLAFTDAGRYAVRRSDPLVGDVVVHFPRRGFSLRPVKD